MRTNIGKSNIRGKKIIKKISKPKLRKGGDPPFEGFDEHIRQIGIKLEDVKNKLELLQEVKNKLKGAKIEEIEDEYRIAIYIAIFLDTLNKPLQFFNDTIPSSNDNPPSSDSDYYNYLTKEDSNLTEEEDLAVKKTVIFLLIENILNHYGLNKISVFDGVPIREYLNLERVYLEQKPADIFNWLFFTIFPRGIDRAKISITIINVLYDKFIEQFDITYLKIKRAVLKPLPKASPITERQKKINYIATELLQKIQDIKDKFDGHFDKYKYSSFIDENIPIDKLKLPHYNNFICIYEFLKRLIGFLSDNLLNSDNFEELFTRFFKSIKDNSYYEKINDLLIEHLGKKEDVSILKDATEDNSLKSNHSILKDATKDNYLKNLKSNIIKWLLLEKYTAHDDRLDILIKVVDIIYAHFIYKCKNYVINGDKICSGGASKVVVKKALNPYNKYVAKQFPSMKKKFPNEKASEIMKKIAIEWNKTKA